MEWDKNFWELLELHRGKAVGIFAGLVFGILTIIFGFWKTLFLAACIFIGYIIGTKIDESDDMKNYFKKFWNQS